jgi:hypothetical protein
MDWGITLGLIGIVCIPLTVALTMSASSPGEFNFIRSCFILAAILMVGSALMLHRLDNMPLWARVSVAAVVGALASGALVFALDWVRNKEALARKQLEPIAEAPPIFELRREFRARNS